MQLRFIKSLHAFNCHIVSTATGLALARTSKLFASYKLLAKCRRMHRGIVT